MSDHLSDLLKSALALSESDREWLAYQLLDGLPVQSAEEIEAEILAELNRRKAEAEKDPSRLIPWSEAKGIMFS
jgi:putative addiction module component (TIGR02574 family)